MENTCELSHEDTAIEVIFPGVRKCRQPTQACLVILRPLLFGYEETRASDITGVGGCRNLIGPYEPGPAICRGWCRCGETGTDKTLRVAR